MVRHPFPQGSCNGHVLLVAFMLANSKALSLSQPPASEMSAVDPSFNRRPENALEHFLLAASALTVASVRFVSRCIVSSSSTAMTSNFLKRIMAHPMIPAELYPRYRASSGLGPLAFRASPWSSRRLLSSGTPMFNSRSKQPKRRSAASMVLSLLVAPMMIVCPRPFTPSMSVTNWETMRVLSRLRAMESILSMKTMARAFFSTSSKALRRLDSASPKWQ